MSADIGGRLRNAREQRGISLPDAAKRTKLSIAVLQAIERNDFASLPGGMFRKAYLRTLSAEFGLDPDAIAAEYCAAFELPDEAKAGVDAILEQQCLQQLTPAPRRSLATLAALAASAVAWFMLQSRPASSTLPQDHEVHESTAAPVPGEVAIGLADAPLGDARPVATAAPTAALPLRIEMVANGWCWVAAESDGRRVMYRLVEPGERVMIEGHRLISLRLGDAGAVTLSINDGPTRSPGSAGEVAELEITRDNVEGLRGGAMPAVADTSSAQA